MSQPPYQSSPQGGQNLPPVIPQLITSHGGQSLSSNSQTAQAATQSVVTIPGNAIFPLDTAAEEYLAKIKINGMGYSCIDINKNPIITLEHLQKGIVQTKKETATPRQKIVGLGKLFLSSLGGGLVINGGAPIFLSTVAQTITFQSNWPHFALLIFGLLCFYFGNKDKE